MEKLIKVVAESADSICGEGWAELLEYEGVSYDGQIADIDVLNKGLIEAAEKLGKEREGYGRIRVITFARYTLASQWTERGVFEKGWVRGTAIYEGKKR